MLRGIPSQGLSIQRVKNVYHMFKINGAYNNRNGPERTGMDWNAPEWASITGMDIKINLFTATKFIFYQNLS